MQAVIGFGFAGRASLRTCTAPHRAATESRQGPGTPRGSHRTARCSKRRSPCRCVNAAPLRARALRAVRVAHASERRTGVAAQGKWRPRIWAALEPKRSVRSCFDEPVAERVGRTSPGLLVFCCRWLTDPRTSRPRRKLSALRPSLRSGRGGSWPTGWLVRHPSPATPG